MVRELALLRDIGGTATWLKTQPGTSLPVELAASASGLGRSTVGTERQGEEEATTVLFATSTLHPVLELTPRDSTLARTRR